MEGAADIPKIVKAVKPPVQAPKNQAKDLPKNSLNFQEVFPVTGLGIIPSLIKNPKDTAGFTCPPEKGATIKIAANNDKVTNQSYPSLAQIPWANIAVPTNSHQKSFQSNKFVTKPTEPSIAPPINPFPSSFFSVTST